MPDNVVDHKPSMSDVLKKLEPGWGEVMGKIKRHESSVEYENKMREKEKESYSREEKALDGAELLRKIEIEAAVKAPGAFEEYVKENEEKRKQDEINTKLTLEEKAKIDKNMPLPTDGAKMLEIAEIAAAVNAPKVFEKYIEGNPDEEVLRKAELYQEIKDKKELIELGKLTRQGLEKEEVLRKAKLYQEIQELKDQKQLMELGKLTKQGLELEELKKNYENKKEEQMLFKTDKSVFEARGALFKYLGKIEEKTGLNFDKYFEDIVTVHSKKYGVKNDFQLAKSWIEYINKSNFVEVDRDIVKDMGIEQALSVLEETMKYIILKRIPNIAEACNYDSVRLEKFMKDDLETNKFLNKKEPWWKKIFKKKGIDTTENVYFDKDFVWVSDASALSDEKSSEEDYQRALKARTRKINTNLESGNEDEINKIVKKIELKKMGKLFDKMMEIDTKLEPTNEV